MLEPGGGTDQRRKEKEGPIKEDVVKNKYKVGFQCLEVAGNFEF